MYTNEKKLINSKALKDTQEFFARFGKNQYRPIKKSDSPRKGKSTETINEIIRNCNKFNNLK